LRFSGRTAAWLLAAAALAGCGSTGGTTGGGGTSASDRSVLDITWGWGWESTASSGPYRDMTPVERERMLDYYRSRVTEEDAAGNALPAVEQVRFEAKAESNAPTGAAVEPVSFVDSRGRAVRLEDYEGKKALVLVFTRGFPGYICPLCTSYTAQVAHRYAEIAAAGAEVLLVFPGSPDRVEEFVRAAREILELEGPGALPFPVLLDMELKNVKAFGIEGELARPSTYVIDRKGTVRFAYVGDQPHERPDVDTLLGELGRLMGD